MFEFYKSGDDPRPSKFGIVEFVVQEQVDRSKWLTVWELSGEQSLSSIKYGAEYEGLDEIVAAKSLSRGAKYRVLASEITWPNPKGYSAVFFSFDEDGELVASDAH